MDTKSRHGGGHVRNHGGSGGGGSSSGPASSAPPDGGFGAHGHTMQHHLSSVSGPSPQLAAFLRWIQTVSDISSSKGGLTQRRGDVALTAREVLNEMKKDLSFTWLHQYINSQIWAQSSTAAQPSSNEGQPLAAAASSSQFAGYIKNMPLDPLPVSTSLCFSVLSDVAPYALPVEIFTVVALLERIEHVRKVSSGCHVSLKRGGGGGGGISPTSVTPADLSRANSTNFVPASLSSSSVDSLDEDSVINAGQRKKHGGGHSHHSHHGPTGSHPSGSSPHHTNLHHSHDHHHHHHRHHQHSADADIAFTDLGWTILCWIGRRCGSVEDVVSLSKPFMVEAATALLKFQKLDVAGVYTAVPPLAVPLGATTRPCCSPATKSHHHHLASPGTAPGLLAAADLGDYVAEALDHWIDDRLLHRAALFLLESSKDTEQYHHHQHPHTAGAATVASLQDVLTPLRPYSQSGVGHEGNVLCGDDAPSPGGTAKQLVSLILGAAGDSSDDDAGETAGAISRAAVAARSPNDTDLHFFQFPESGPLHQQSPPCAIVASTSTSSGMFPAIPEPSAVAAATMEDPHQQVVGIATLFLCIIFRSRVPHSTRIAELADVSVNLGRRPSHAVVLDAVLQTVLRVAAISDVGRFTDVPLLRQDIADHFDFPAKISPSKDLRKPSGSNWSVATPNSLRSATPQVHMGGQHHSNSSIDEIFLESFTVKNTSIVVEMLQTPRNALSIFITPMVAGGGGAMAAAGSSRALMMSPDLLSEEDATDSRASNRLQSPEAAAGDDPALISPSAGSWCPSNLASARLGSDDMPPGVLLPSVYSSSSTGGGGALAPDGASNPGAPGHSPIDRASPSPVRLEPPTSRAPLAADRYRTTTATTAGRHSADVDRSPTTAVQEYSVPRSVASTQVGAVGDLDAVDEDDAPSPLGTVAMAVTSRSKQQQQQQQARGRRRRQSQDALHATSNGAAGREDGIIFSDADGDGAEPTTAGRSAGSKHSNSVAPRQPKEGQGRGQCACCSVM